MGQEALDRLAAINVAREKARREHPNVVAFIDACKEEFPNGAAHFYPKGRVFLEPKGVTLDKMVLESLLPIVGKKKKADKRSMKERNIK